MNLARAGNEEENANACYKGCALAGHMRGSGNVGKKGHMEVKIHEKLLKRHFGLKGGILQGHTHIYFDLKSSALCD